MKSITLRRFILVSFLSIFSMNAQADVPIDLNFYKHYVNKKNCTQSQQVYYGCIISLQILVGSVDPKLDLKTLPSSIADFLKFNQAPSAEKSKTAEVKEITDRNELLSEIQKNKQKFFDLFGPTYEPFRQSSNNPIEDSLNFLKNKYATALKEDLILYAVNEFIHISSDPHSDWRSIEETKNERQQKDTELVGLGMAFTSSPEGLLVYSVFTDSPAEKAGIQIDDVIISMNGTVLKGTDLGLVVKTTRASENRPLRFEILRAGQKISLNATPKKLKRSVVSENTEQVLGHKVGMIKLDNFMYEDGCKEIQKILEKYKQNDIDHVILDLRQNPGGNVGVAQCIAGLFVGMDETVFYSGNDDFPEDYYGSTKQNMNDRAALYLKRKMIDFVHLKGAEAQSFSGVRYVQNLQTEESFQKAIRSVRLFDRGLIENPSTEFKAYSGHLSVLIDAGSASASELLSGALKDLNRAFIIGQVSFGKGSMQRPVDQNGKFALFATQGLFYQPGGLTNQTVGITPHIEAFRRPTPYLFEQLARREKDLFLFPLQPDSVRPFIENAPTMNTLQPDLKCIEGKELKKLYQETKSSIWKDMQVLTAVGAMVCDSK